MEKIKWAIFDDFFYLCKSFEMGLQGYEDLEFVGSACNTACFIKMLKEKTIDVLLLDIMISGESTGIEMLPTINEISPDTQVIMLTSYDDDELIYKAFANNADDYLMKEVSVEELHEAIINVYNGRAKVNVEIAHKLAQQIKKNEIDRSSILYMIEIISKLSESEFEILKLLSEGLSYKEIAEKKVIEQSTVRTHVSRMLKKFNCNNINKFLSDLDKLQFFLLFKKKS